MLKKISFIVSCIISLLFGGGCITGKTPEQLHTETVDKLSEYLENMACQKIDASEYLSEKAKVELKEEVSKTREEILIKIEILHAKIMSQKETIQVED